MAKKQESLSKKISSFFQVNESTLSTVLGALVVVVIGVLIFNYFKSSSPTDNLPENPLEQFDEGKIEIITNQDGLEVPKNLPEIYQVKTGDQLWHIAEKHYGSGYNWVDIAAANKLVNANYLLVGQELSLPQAAIRKPVVMAEISEPVTITQDSYVVQKGDHLWKIAVQSYGDGYKWVEIAKVNNIASPDLIEIGQELKLPR